MPLLALPLFDERLSPLGTAGVALVVCGIVGLHLTPRAVSAAASASRLVGAPGARLEPRPPPSGPRQARHAAPGVGGGYVVAARELSIVFSTIIGSLWLGEGRLGPRLLGAGVILAGVACVALAR